MFGIFRTMLAINVVLLHIFNIPTIGNYSVSLFFILSGFLMSLIMHKTYGYNLNGFKVFWINRGLRLYPIYFVIIILTIITITYFPYIVRHPAIFLPKTFLEWSSNFTMLYPNIVPHRFEPRIVPPSWALTNELFFYVLISLGISKSFKRTLIWFIISVLYFVFTYKFYDLATFRYSAIPAASLPFSIGALLFWLSQKNKVKLKPNYYLVFGSLILFYLNSIYGKNLGDVSIYLNMLIGAFIVFELYKIKNSKFFKVDKYIGFYSYPIYLSHFVVCILFLEFSDVGNTVKSFKLNLESMPFYLLILFIINFLLVHIIDINLDRVKSNLKKKKL